MCGVHAALHVVVARRIKKQFLASCRSWASFKAYALWDAKRHFLDAFQPSEFLKKYLLLNGQIAKCHCRLPTNKHCVDTCAILRQHSEIGHGPRFIYCYLLGLHKDCWPGWSWDRCHPFIGTLKLSEVMEYTAIAWST